MMRDEEEAVQACVEAICNLGCRTVNAVIQSLEAGRPIPQTEGLSADAVARVLAELKAIMAVYDRCGP